MRDSFIVYRSFYEAVLKLDSDSQLQVFKAIFEFSLNGKEPELNGMAEMFFILIKPTLIANNSRYENGKLGAEHGKKGGRPAKTETPKKPLKNPTGVLDENPKETPYKDKDKDKYKDKDVDKDEYKDENKDKDKDKIKEIDSLFSFSNFCKHYPKKIGIEKCMSKYYNLSIDEIKKIAATIKEYSEWEQFPGWTHPKAETYIEEKRWNTDLKSPNKKDDVKIQLDPNRPAYGKTWEEMTDEERHKNKYMANSAQLIAHNKKMGDEF